MNQSSFERLGEERWRAFEESLASVRYGYKLAEDVDPDVFVEGYQLVARDLSVAQARGYSRALIERLNRLSRAGHNVLYVRRAGFLASLLAFIFGGFARRVRSEARYVAVAGLLFALPLFGMAIAVNVNPELVYSVMSPADVSSMESMYDPANERFGRERQSDADLYMFGFYIMNNVGISFQVFATGLAFGVGAIGYIVYNGLVIGAVAGHLIHVGFASTFLPFVSGHGSFELTAIVLAGGAGLILGHALIAPGEYSRGEALKRRGRDAIEIIFGSTLMLFIAAFVEAFWSSSTVLPSMVKYVVGAGLWVLVIGYLVMSGRNRAA